MVLTNASSVDVVVLADDLTDAETLQIQNIVMREFSVETSTVHITIE